MKFKDLKFEDISKTHGKNAVQAWHDFPNGFSASVIRHLGSYGNEKGLYEVGIFFGPRMCDPLGWNDTVRGYLNEDDVTETLKQLQELKTGD